MQKEAKIVAMGQKRSFAAPFRNDRDGAESGTADFVLLSKQADSLLRSWSVPLGASRAIWG
jgi:hypothetical protein